MTVIFGNYQTYQTFIIANEILGFRLIERLTLENKEKLTVTDLYIENHVKFKFEFNKILLKFFCSHDLKHFFVLLPF